MYIFEMINIGQYLFTINEVVITWRNIHAKYGNGNRKQTTSKNVCNIDNLLILNVTRQIKNSTHVIKSTL